MNDRAKAARRPRVLLITPPLVQLNTPYPATTYLSGLLADRGYPVFQADLSLETALGLFSRGGLERLFAAIRASLEDGAERRPEVARALAQERRYLETIDAVVRFLQGGDPTFATRICHGEVLPEGPRFDAAAALDDGGDGDAWAFGALGIADRARHLATLYLDDLADLAQHTVAPHFGLSRYGERLATAAASFDPLLAALDEPPGLIDRFTEEALAPHLARARPDLVGLTVPFPGNLYGALRIARLVRAAAPTARVALGGGYVNTELRLLRDPRLFDFVDYVTLDDGERPLLCLLEHLAGARDADRLRRTFVRRPRGDGAGAEVVLIDGAGEPDVPQAESGVPTYRDLPLDRYLSVIELLNPMHRLWSEGRWNKLTVAHGCYWKRCTFCDVGLDYIARYDPVATGALCDRIDALVAETGGSGFHFVDEAAPPLALVELALELLQRGRTISFWGNIRFEKTFTADVCRLLAAAGCIAVTGGLEVASDRLLALIDKGVTVAQVARVARAFADAGVMVHAYLMYGFPTQTAAETVDSLEMVRQLFAVGALHSAFWHRFTLTRHSPIARDPAAYRIRVLGPPVGDFANNDLRHRDPDGADHDRFTDGLRRAVFNFMHGRGLDEDVRTWFAAEGKRRLPSTTVAPDYIERAAGDGSGDPPRPNARMVWIGGPAQAGRDGRRSGLAVAGRGAGRFLPLPPHLAVWLETLLAAATPAGRGARPYPTRGQLREEFPDGSAAFVRFSRGAAWSALAELGLLEVP